MKQQNKISTAQIQKIHIAKKELGITDENYRSILSGFTTGNGETASSCKDLTFEQAEILLGTFQRLGFKVKSKNKILKYEEFANRAYKFATPKMMRKIDALWHTKSRAKTDASMHEFINRITGKSHISFLLRGEASKVINAINNLKQD